MNLPNHSDTAFASLFYQELAEFTPTSVLLDDDLVRDSEADILSEIKPTN